MRHSPTSAPISLKQFELHTAGAAEIRGGQYSFFAVEAGPTCGNLEHLPDLFRKDPLAAHPGAEGGVVELAAAQVAQTRHHPRFFAGLVIVEPLEEDVLYGVGQSQENIARAACAGRGRSGEDAGQFMLGQSRDDRCHQHVDRHAGVREQPDGPQAVLGPGGARLELARKVRVQRGDGNID